MGYQEKAMTRAARDVGPSHGLPLEAHDGAPGLERVTVVSAGGRRPTLMPERA